MRSDSEDEKFALARRPVSDVAEANSGPKCNSFGKVHDTLTLAEFRVAIWFQEKGNNTGSGR